MVVEAIVIAAAWAIQISAVLVVAFLLAVAGKAVEEAVWKRKVKWLPRVVAIFLLLCAALAALAMNPPVICGETAEHRLTDALREQVRGGAAGLYSWKIPLVPLCAEITAIEDCAIDGKGEQNVEFTVYYFCIGKQRMEYDTHDGYNAYPMFGLQ